MHIIKLNAIASTNSYLKNLAATQLLNDYTVVTADYQTNGRGQMDTKWESNATENLLFSVFKVLKSISVEDVFYVNMLVAIAIKQVLEDLQVPHVAIKWPNDILAHDNKVAGILIENSIKGTSINHTIIGVGLNVNQISFKVAPNATSIKAITGKTYNLETLLMQLIEQLQEQLNLLKCSNYKPIVTKYNACLYRKEETTNFKDVKGVFEGKIIEVLPTGELKIRKKSSEEVLYKNKEITMLF